MTDTVAELVELWSAGLVDAAANAQAASVRAAETDTVTVTEGTRKNQFKGYADDGSGNSFYSFSAEKIKETSTQQTLHAVVSDDAAANGDFSTNSIRNSAENVKEKHLSATPPLSARLSI